MLIPVGVYVFNVLARGLSNVNDLFESALQELFKGLAGVVNIVYDILVFGATQKEHNNNVISFLERCIDVNLKLNADKVKCKFKEVPFFGKCITASGIKPDPVNVGSNQRLANSS